MIHREQNHRKLKPTNKRTGGNFVTVLTIKILAGLVIGKRIRLEVLNYCTGTNSACGLMAQQVFLDTANNPYRCPLLSNILELAIVCHNRSKVGGLDDMG